MRENELLNVFKVTAGHEVITVSAQGSVLKGGVCVALITGLLSCCFSGFLFYRLFSVLDTGASTCFDTTSKPSCQRCKSQPHFVSFLKVFNIIFTF